MCSHCPGAVCSSTWSLLKLGFPSQADNILYMCGQGEHVTALAGMQTVVSVCLLSTEQRHVSGLRTSVPGVQKAVHHAFL